MNKLIEKFKDSLIESHYFDSLHPHTAAAIHTLRRTTDPDHIEKASRSDNVEVAINAAAHPHATARSLHNGLNHGSHEVRREVFSNLNATKEHTKRGMSDEHSDVAFAAYAHNVNHRTPEESHETKQYALKHGHPELRDILSRM
jgi:hypothetical protein